MPANHKPHICIVTPGTFPIPSAHSSSVERVVEKMTEQLKEHFDCTVIGKKTAAQPAKQSREGITYIRPLYQNANRYVARVIHQLKSIRPSVVQVENRPSYVRRISRALPDCRIWLSLHSVTFISPKIISHKRLRKIFRCVERIIVNSSFLKAHLLEMFPNIMHKVKVIHLAVDQRDFPAILDETVQEQRNTTLQQLGYEGKKIILYVGRLIPIKGVHHLLHVLPSIIKQHPEAILVIVGGASYGSNRITSYVKNLHRIGNTMPCNVRFIPFTPYYELHRWFSIADLVAVPSAANEAFGLVNVEAMAAGLPVIATNAGGIREIVVHERTGLLINPDHYQSDLRDGMLQLLRDDKLRKRMGEASMERVKRHFSWPRAAELWKEVYDECARE